MNYVSRTTARVNHLNFVLIGGDVLHQLPGHLLHVRVAVVELVPRQQRGGVRVGRALDLHSQCGSLLVLRERQGGRFVQVRAGQLRSLCEF